MTNNRLTTQDVIQLALEAGAEITSEKGQQSGTCEAKTVFLKKGLCNIKVSYMKLGDKIIDVQSACCCNGYGLYEPLIEDCLKNGLQNKQEDNNGKC